MGRHDVDRKQLETVVKKLQEKLDNRSNEFKAWRKEYHAKHGKWPKDTEGFLGEQSSTIDVSEFQLCRWLGTLACWFEHIDASEASEATPTCAYCNRNKVVAIRGKATYCEVCYPVPDPDEIKRLTEAQLPPISRPKPKNKIYGRPGGGYNVNEK